MAGIKTKDTIKGAIKQLDRAAIASDRIRRAYIQTKEKAESSVNPSEANPEEYASERIESGVQNISHEAAHQAGKIGRESVYHVKQDYTKAKEAVQEYREARAEQKDTRMKIKTREAQREAASQPENVSAPKRGNAVRNQRTISSKVSGEQPVLEQNPATGERATELGRKRVEQSARTRRNESTMRSRTQGRQTVKTIEKPAKRVKESAWSAGKTIKTTQKATAKTAQKGIKTAERTAKTTIKTSKEAEKVAQKSAQAAAMAAQKAAQAAKATAKAVATSVKAAVKVTIAAIKAIIAATKSLGTAIAAGGWVAVLVIVIIMLIALIATSPFGIFFAGGSTTADVVPISVAVSRINYDFGTQLGALQGASYDSIDISGSMADWPEILAVFAVKVAGTNEADAMDVATMDAARVAKLKAVFWDMNSISSTVESISHPDSNPDDDVDDSWVESILHIAISAKTAEDMKTEYCFSQEQKGMLDTILQNRSELLSLIGDLRLISAKAADVIRRLPADLSAERREIVKMACSLAGKVNYFWGGKSLVLGWDSSWGSIRQVWAAGSPTTGTYRPYGLDCSGFVDWVFYNVSDGDYVIGHGGGTVSQHIYSTDISWEDALPGDLVFYPRDSHVGIVAGRDESGELLIIHCAGGVDGIVITGANGFSTVARPLYYGN